MKLAAVGASAEVTVAALDRLEGERRQKRRAREPAAALATSGIQLVGYLAAVSPVLQLQAGGDHIRITNDEFCITNDGFSIKDNDICITNDDLSH